MIDQIDAVSSYARAAAFAAPAADPAPAAVEAPAGADFAGIVGALVGETGAALRTAEHASAQQVAGKGDLIDVVTAIGSADLALNTMVAVRDRVIGAYNDIMRMQV